MGTTLNKAFTLIAVLLFSVTFSQGQVEKGMTIIGLQGNWDIGDSGSGQTTGELSILKAISDRWMIGGSFSFAGDNGNYSNLTEQFERFDEYRISPSARYYITSAKWAPFISMANHFVVLDYYGSASGILGSELEVGLGLTHFFGRDVAVEAQLSTSVFRFGGSRDFDREINLNIGVKFFLGRSSSMEVDFLPDRIYRKGVLSTSSRFAYRQRLGNDNARLINIAPDMEYFVSDHLSLSANLTITDVGTSQFSDKTQSVGLGATRYFQLAKKTFFNVNASGKYTNRTWIHDARLNEVLDLSLQGELSHFLGPKRIYLGYRYSYLDFINGGPASHNFNQAIYGGMDYFLSKNVFLRGVLDVNLSKNNENYIGRGSTGILKLGLGFNLSR